MPDSPGSATRDTAALDPATRRWIGARMAACVTAKAGGWFWLPCMVLRKGRD